MEEILKNFGASLYIHRALQKIASSAKIAVAYLEKKGVFSKTAKLEKRKKNLTW